MDGLVGHIGATDADGAGMAPCAAYNDSQKRTLADAIPADDGDHFTAA